MFDNLLLAGWGQHGVQCHTSHVTRHAVTPVAGAGASPVCLHNTQHSSLCRLHLFVCIIYISENFVEWLLVTLASCVCIIHCDSCDCWLGFDGLCSEGLWSWSLCSVGRSSTCIVQCVILWDHFGENMMLAFLLFRGITLLKNFDSCNLLSELHLYLLDTFNLCINLVTK